MIWLLIHYHENEIKECAFTDDRGMLTKLKPQVSKHSDSSLSL